MTLGQNSAIPKFEERGAEGQNLKKCFFSQLIENPKFYNVSKSQVPRLIIGGEI